MCQGRQGELSQLIDYYGKVAGISIEYRYTEFIFTYR